MLHQLVHDTSPLPIQDLTPKESFMRNLQFLTTTDIAGILIPSSISFQTIFSPEAIQLIALMHIRCRKAIIVTFCPLNGSDKVNLDLTSRLHTLVLRNCSNCLNLHARSPIREMKCGL
jgi:hypothetical protein